MNKKKALGALVMDSSAIMRIKERHFGGLLCFSLILCSVLFLLSMKQNHDMFAAQKFYFYIKDVFFQFSLE